MSVICCEIGSVNKLFLLISADKETQVRSDDYGRDLSSVQTLLTKQVNSYINIFRKCILWFENLLVMMITIMIMMMIITMIINNCIINTFCRKLSMLDYRLLRKRVFILSLP